MALVHQVHHSPQRIEVITSFYKHPLEIVANGAALERHPLSGWSVSSPRAATLAVTLTGLAELFYHWNVPHAVLARLLHPASGEPLRAPPRGRHRNNYADLPLWDMLFGTFQNPRERESQCGFGAEREPQLRAMLRGRDVRAAGWP